MSVVGFDPHANLEIRELHASVDNAKGQSRGTSDLKTKRANAKILGA